MVITQEDKKTRAVLEKETNVQGSCTNAVKVGTYETEHRFASARKSTQSEATQVMFEPSVRRRRRRRRWWWWSENLTVGLRGRSCRQSGCYWLLNNLNSRKVWGRDGEKEKKEKVEAK